MINPELGFNKDSFLCILRIKYKNGTLAKHIIELTESIPNFKWGFDWCTKKQFIQFCKDHEIESRTQFYKWCKKNKRPDNIPSTPNRIYKNFSWGDISGIYKNVDWCTKEEFIQFCKDHEIKSRTQFRKWCKENKRPYNISSEPNIIYKNWSWGDISGKYMNVDWCTKEEFIQWCKDNGIKNNLQFIKWCKENKRPYNISSDPNKTYKNFSWGDISGRYRNVNWCTKKQFIQFCKDHEIKTKTQFRKWCKKNKRPYNIPYNPNTIYENWSWKLIK